MGSMGFGLQILISELLLKLKHEGKITWKETWAHVKGNWKDLLRKGSRLLFTYLAVLIPIILIINVLYTAVIGLLIYSVAQSPSSSPVITVVLVVMLFVSTIFLAILLILVPILWFVTDTTCVRIAEGKKVWTGFRHGFRDVKQNRTAVWYYVVGVLVLTIVSMLFFPLAFILQPLIPILSKAYFITNRDMFYD
jgi:hypothetical protein